MSPVGFKIAFPANEWLQTQALDCVATRIGRVLIIWPKWNWWWLDYQKCYLMEVQFKYKFGLSAAQLT
jgi:hypothetical protein